MPSRLAEHLKDPGQAIIAVGGLFMVLGVALIVTTAIVGRAFGRRIKRCAPERWAVLASESARLAHRVPMTDVTEDMRRFRVHSSEDFGDAGVRSLRRWSRGLVKATVVAFALSALLGITAYVLAAIQGR